jgi:hypothetical protein
MYIVVDSTLSRNYQDVIKYFKDDFNLSSIPHGVYLVNLDWAMDSITFSYLRNPEIGGYRVN